ncbi:MAG: efflux transporter outer membrane subunit [Thermodesulfobacteriota bacterium]
MIYLKNNGLFNRGAGKYILLAFVALSLSLCGCVTVGPDYTRPEMNASSNWNSKLENGLENAAVDQKNIAEWWKKLNDPVLTKLVRQAVNGNLDMAMARATLQEARARRGLAEAGQFPTLDAKGSITKGKASKDTGSPVTSNTHELYNAGFDAGWELDIFGGVRRAVEAAQADLEAQRENLRDVLVSLCAEVALNYVEIRTYQSRLDIARKNIRIQKRTRDISKSLHEAGLGTALEVQQASYNLSSTRSRIPYLQAGLQAAKNRLAVLTGQKPGALEKMLFKHKPIPTINSKVAVGVPAETLRRRPDVRRAERKLAAQTARIGEAKSDLFPKFRLLGSVGLETIEHESNFFHSDYSFWSIGPSVSWNVFDAGAIRRNIEIQSARQQQQLINYEKTVLSALEETENALTNFAREQERKRELTDAVHSARKAENMANENYKAGLVDFINVLSTQRAVLNYEEELALSKGALTSNLISLYKALGGGWQNYWEEETSGAAKDAGESSES